ncbi:hypothetical protein EON63_09550 [archaeon]|nr:MAG: hypothetical protein EON63_09550 [archaeon]
MMDMNGGKFIYLCSTSMGGLSLVSMALSDLFRRNFDFFLTLEGTPKNPGREKSRRGDLRGIFQVCFSK